MWTPSLSAARFMALAALLTLTTRGDMDRIKDDLGPHGRITAWQASAAGLTAQFTADGPYEGQILFRHGTPLVLKRAEGVQAELRYRDDCYGYQVYGLTVKGVAGTATIELAVVPVLAHPIPNTPEMLTAFTRSFVARPLRFPDDPAAFAAWQRARRDELQARLMGGHRLERVPPAPALQPVKDDPAFRLFQMTYHSRANRTAVGLLAIPKAAPDPAGKWPLVLALHGHEATWGAADPGAFTPGHADNFCHYFATHGFAVFQPPSMNHSLQDPDWTLLGEWTWDAITGLDAVALGSKEADLGRLAVIGLSTGGTLAQLVAALDERPKVVVCAGIFTTVNHLRTRFRIPPHCQCGAFAALYDFLEPCDTVALAAPKWYQLQHGRQDAVMCPGAAPAKLQLDWNTGTMPQAEFDLAYAEVRRAYTVAGVPAQVELVIHPGAHAVDSPAAYAWITKALAAGK